jgi:hypothetical protein
MEVNEIFPSQHVRHTFNTRVRVRPSGVRVRNVERSTTGVQKCNKRSSEVQQQQLKSSTHTVSIVRDWTVATTRGVIFFHTGRHNVIFHHWIRK